MLVESVLIDNGVFTLAEISRACDVHADWVIALVDEGILEPRGRNSRQWQFSGLCLRRAKTVRRLQRDLGVNLAGAAVAIELMEEMDRLRARLKLFDDV